MNLVGIHFYLETYGCSLNMADSDMISARLKGLGYQRVESIEQAQVIILNTCGVKEPTEDRAIHRIQELYSISIPVIVTGCLPKIALPRILSVAPDIAAILGPQSIESLGLILPRVIDGERGIHHLESDTSSKLRFFEGPPNSVICTIPICEGCLGACTYCAVKFARGRVKSYPIQEIIDVVERCVHLGYREIRLTSQDAGVYGFDLDRNLVDLLSHVSSIDGDHIIRLGMFNPDLVIEFLPELLSVMSSKHFFKFFHAPLQSGSDSILKVMGRKYTVKDWIDIVNTIRHQFQEVTIATDIITGFPGESDEDFEETMDVIKRTGPEVVNISKYGDRPGTKASKSKEKVHTGVKKDRSRQLSLTASEISLEHNQSWIGKTIPVLVTGLAQRGGLLCRNITYRPIIVDADITFGTWATVQIVSASKTHLIGEVISAP